MSKACRVCQQNSLFVCTRCSQVFYCSESCQRKDWPSHNGVCARALGLAQSSSLDANSSPSSTVPEPVREEENDEQDLIDSLSFYISQLYVIMKPVTACILLSVLWVKLANPYTPYFATFTGSLSFTRPGLATQFGSDGSQGSNDSSLITASIIAAQIVVMTVVIALLIKYNKVQFIYYFFGLVTTVILGVFAFSVGTMLIGISNIPFDWITFSFFLFNFVSMGICSIFWQAPLELQQVYLVLMSSMMAFSLSNLPPLVTWILLSFLAVWDLIAVLCPYGPLRIMIESAQRNNIELPSALIYTTALSFMANIDSNGSTNEQPAYQDSHSLVSLLDRNGPSNEQGNISSSEYSAATSNPVYRYQENIEMQSRSSDREAQSAEREPDRSERNGLKLGLGDFVFYSVLVGRASLSDWLTTVGCMLSVLSGLVITIYILALKRKPLPALPISIFFGILVYFMVSLTLANMIQSLTTGPFQVNPGPLRAGTVGLGFVFI